MRYLFFIFICLTVSIFAKEKNHYSSLVLGGGPGALTSGIYLSRAGVDHAVIVGEKPGGPLMDSEIVQNWPSEAFVSGEELIEKMRLSAKENQVQFIDGEVVSVDFQKRPFTVWIKKIGEEKKTKLTCDSCIVAMGCTPNKLQVKGEEKFWGKGVTNCATCDGPLYKNKIVAVVGGGDAALLEAEYLSAIAEKVYLLVRKDKFKAIDQIRKNRVLQNPKVQIYFNTEIEEIIGDKEGLTSLQVTTKGKKETLLVDGLFLAIGSKPNTEIFTGQLKLLPSGHIALINEQESSVKGVYPIGDIADNKYRQAITASGDGAKAAMQAQEFLQEKPVIACHEVENFAELQQKIKDSSLPVVVDFYAPWCRPCKALSPQFEAISYKHSDKYLFLKVNVENIPEASNEYHIRSMPTVILFKNSAPVERMTGTKEISHYFDSSTFLQEQKASEKLF